MTDKQVLEQGSIPIPSGGDNSRLVVGDDGPTWAKPSIMWGVRRVSAINNPQRHRRLCLTLRSPDGGAPFEVVTRTAGVDLYLTDAQLRELSYLLQESSQEVPQ